MHFAFFLHCEMQRCITSEGCISPFCHFAQQLVLDQVLHKQSSLCCFSLTIIVVKGNNKLSLPFHHHIQNKTQQQHIRWKLSLPLAVQDISRTFLAIAGIFVSYSGHVKDEEGKKPDINGQTVAGYPPQIAKAFQTGQLFSQHLSVLLWLSKYSFCSPTISSWGKTKR